MVVLLLPVLLQGPQVLLRERLLLDGDLKKRREIYIVLAGNSNLSGNLNFGGKWKFWWREIQILAGNSNFGGKFKFWWEIQILA
jgi:hypothetical protein